jgi:hypothetical protein
VNHIERKPGIVRLTRRLENAVSLDRPVGALEPTITSVFGSGRRGWLLRGVNGSATLFTRCSPMSRSAPGLPPAFLIFSVAPKILCGPNTYRQRPARRGTNGLDRMGRVGNRGTTRQAGRPCPRRYQWPLDRYLRNLVGGPPPGPAQYGCEVGTRCGPGLGSRRLFGRSSHRCAQCSDPPSRVRTFGWCQLTVSPAFHFARE